MRLLPLGWGIVHSLWQCTLIAGIAAMVLSLMGEPRARARYAVACAALAAMALAALVTPFAGEIGPGFVRYRAAETVDAAIPMPTLVAWARAVLPAAAILWLAGIVVQLGRLGLECRRVRALRRDLQDAGPEVRAHVADLSARMSLRVAVAVHRSPRAEVPMVLGWRRPTILLPVEGSSTLPPEQLRTVLAHELAHVGRRDHLANLWLMLAETLLFHHPAARWIARRIRAEREYCCDDAAVQVSRDAAGYARALAALEDARVDCRPMLAASSGTLLDRIQRLAGCPRKTLTPLRGVALLTAASIIAAAILVVAMALPPSLPSGVKVRSRMPPSGIQPPSGARSLPRTPMR